MSGMNTRWQRQAKGIWNSSLYNAFRHLPTALVSAAGCAMGSVMSRLGARAKRLGAAKTFAAFGAAGDPSSAAGAWCRDTGRTLAEMARLDRIWQEGRVSVEGAANLQTGGQPLLVVGLHTGNWELIGVALAGLGHAPAAIYSPPSDLVERRIATHAREAYGCRLISPRTMAPSTYFGVSNPKPSQLCWYAW